jgi:predicted ATPase
VSSVNRPALVFIGFMGAGKSTALAAAREAGARTPPILTQAEFLRRLGIDQRAGEIVGGGGNA